MSLPVPAII